MPAQDLYILPEDVHVMPVSELPEAARNHFTYEESDFVITHRGARNTSKVIDASSASLIKEFKTPRSLPEGIFTYSHLNNRNANEVLTEAYPFLVRLRSEGFLVLHQHEKKEQGSGFVAGGLFKDYEVIVRLNGVADTEIYKLKKNGSHFAMKLLKTTTDDGTLSNHFLNEVAVLTHLDGIVNPALAEHGEHEGNPYLITEWIEGTPCDDWAEKYRNLSNEENLFTLLSLCRSILNAYAHLHRQGVVHADVHPNNILVNENGEVVLIDFGLSRIVSKQSENDRGGVGFFYEPEYAAAMVNRTAQPPASFRSEQYALGALLYLLLTGKQYLNFSYEKDILFSQILGESPIPFADLDIHLEVAVESILGKALSKNPEDRFASVQHFCEAITALSDSMASKKIHQPRYSFSAFTNKLVQQYGFDSKLMESGLQLSPVCSVNYGAAGIAYFLYRAALVQSDAEVMAAADVWANKACSYAQHGDAAFYAKDIDITPASVGNVSIYHTASGAYLVQALVSKEMYNYNIHYGSVWQFIEAASQPCENPDVTLGKSSLLIGSSLLYHHLLPGNEAVKKELLRFGNSIVKETWNVIDSHNANGNETRILYNGIAHGWAGILYATLAWCKTSSQALPGSFFKHAGDLLASKVEEENFIRWPLSASENASWPGWCHGSAGYVFLWSLLYRFTGDDMYLHTAEKTAAHFLSTNAEGTLANLCCGKSGEVYALLNLYNLTQNEFYFTKAKEMTKAMLPQAYGPQMRNHSLYKGDVGLGVLATEIEHPAFARMPLFEV